MPMVSSKFQYMHFFNTGIKKSHFSVSKGKIVHKISCIFQTVQWRLNFNFFLIENMDSNTWIWKFLKAMVAVCFAGWENSMRRSNQLNCWYALSTVVEYFLNYFAQQLFWFSVIIVQLSSSWNCPVTKQPGI